MTHHISIDDGRIQSVQLAAELTFHPHSRNEETRLRIEAALVSAPVALSSDALAARVRAAIPYGVECVGSTIPELAASIRQCMPPCEPLDFIGQYRLEDIERLTAHWPQRRPVVLTTPPVSGPVNLAFDDVLAEAVRSGQRGITLRLWQWNEAAIILGRSQSLAEEVDANTATRAGFRVYRRASGGGAMVVSPSGVLTYSVILPEGLLNAVSIRQSYEICDAFAVLALRRIGIDAHSIPINDIGNRHGKIAGAAQARRGGVVIHHTTMAYDLNPDDVAEVLRIREPRTPSRGVASAPKVIAPLARFTTKSRDEIASVLVDEFTRRYHAEAVELTATEWGTATELAQEKYMELDLE